MKLSTRHRDTKSKIELSMTSMIDVVFLLLIFFLVTTTFQSPERQLQSNIKVEQQTAAQQSAQLEPAVIDVMTVNGQHVYKIGGLTTNSLEQLAKVLSSFPNKDDCAFVRVGEEVPFEMAAFAINQCKQAGFHVVSYIPTAEKPAE